MNRPIGQHYISKFYLGGFTIPGTEKLWVYDKNKPIPRKQSPRKVAKENHFYSVLGIKGINNVIEDNLAKIESATAPIFQSLQNHDHQFDTPTERYVFGRFICFLAFRTPQFNRYFHIIAQNVAKTQLIEHFKKKGGLEVVVEEFNRRAKSKTTPEQFLETFNKLKIKPPKGSFQILMGEAAMRFIPYFCTMKWLFLRSEKDVFFITSDAPILFHDPSNHNPFFKPGILQKTVQIYFPVNRQLCLLASWEGDGGYRVAEPNLVSDINVKIASEAERCLFSPFPCDVGVKEALDKGRERDSGQISTPRLF